MEVLTNLIERLETVADHLEIAENIKESEPEKFDITMLPVVKEFDSVMNGSFAKYLKDSTKIGGDVEEHSILVKKSFLEVRGVILEAARCEKPSDSILADKLKPLVDSLDAVIKFKDENRKSKNFNHLSTISESIPALGWVTITPAPASHIKEMVDSGTFYSNRVLKEFKDIDETHVSWVKSYTSALKELQEYVKSYHTTGLTWSGKEKAAPGACPPPPPPPPPAFDAPAGSSQSGDGKRAALFQELNRGEEVTSGLKKVTDDMKTHKNPNLRSGATVLDKVPPPVAAKPKIIPGTIELKGNKWFVENFTGKKDIVIEPEELKQTVYIYKCNDCCIEVKGKLNSIVMDSCKKSGLLFNHVISCVDFINCQTVQAQVKTKVHSVNIDKSDGIQFYLNKDSKNVELVYSKCSSMNILVPGKEEGDYVEHPVPEQFKCYFKGENLISEPNKSL